MKPSTKIKPTFDLGPESSCLTCKKRFCTCGRNLDGSMPIKKLIKFKIRSRQSKKFLTVLVHSSLKEFRSSYKKYDIQVYGKVSPLIDDCYGVCHSYTKFRVSKGGKEEISNEVGIIRLSKPTCTTLVVSHELIHGALQIYRQEFNKPASFGSGVSEKEENLAYIYGDLFRQMTNKLYKYNIWNAK